jgi:hypothetical protein
MRHVDFRWKCLLSAAALLVACAGQRARATEILYEKDAPNLGIGIYPLAEQTWRSQVMTRPGEITGKDRVWVGPDFFESEYGEPCLFAKDWLKEFGYSQDGEYKVENGAMVFTTGPKGFLLGIGSRPNDFSRPSPRFGAAWGPQTKDLYRLRLTVEQDVDETDWSFCVSNFQGYSNDVCTFKVKGRGRQDFEVDLGYVRNLTGNCTGFKLHCATPGATVKIAGMKIAPSSAIVHFRKTFTLANQPILAHATFQSPETYDLYVNGQKIDSGTHIYPAGPQKTVDLAPYLVAGENVIAFEREFITWVQRQPEWLFEGVAVDRDGTVTHLLGDASWKTSLKADDGWTDLAFDDTAWAAPILRPCADALVDGTAVSRGLEPKHMGMLDVAPADRQYPVFDDDETPAFRVRLPVGMKGKVSPRLEIFKAGTDAKVETLATVEAKEDGDFLVYSFSPKTREPGPYRLMWTLHDTEGKVLETRREELVLVGPIPQDILPLAGFEEAFAKRLKLVRKIDCAKESGDGTQFIDHAGMYNPAAINKGKVVTEDGMSYRETGPGAWDYFAYRLHLRERGEPFLVEVIIPDNRPRYVYSCVTETFPIPFCNNPGPLGSRGWHSASGTALTGGTYYPLSNGKKALRYIYYPNSFAAAVMVMSGLRDTPAAACEINIYKIEGDLPALALPPTERRFGSHNERISLMTLSTASENPLEMDPGIRNSGHRDAWFNWYRAIERKIRWLRFQGQNMAVEGIYMYNRGDYPSVKHNADTSNQEFDLPHLLLRMYAKNNIHCRLGFEYCNSPAMRAAGEGALSDRKMWQGKQGVHMVDRHGRQLVGTFSDDGINFLHPQVEALMLDTLGEIYDRYQGVGKPDGLFVVVGDWWAPGFIRGRHRDIDSIEAGYDDLTVGLFEKETGVALGIDPADPQRFPRRYDRLMGENRALWLHWRGTKVRAAFQKMSDRIRSGSNKWDMFIYQSTGIQKNTPFDDARLPRSARDTHMETYLAAMGVPLEMYAGQPGISLVTPLLEVDYFPNRSITDDTLSFHGWNTNSGTRDVMRRLDTLYLSTQLNEVDNPASAAKQWLWSHTARGVFVLRGAEDNCMHHHVDAMRDHTPRNVFDSWLDCNMVTAFGEQQRRFAKAFCSTPDAEFLPLPPERARGIVAQVALREGGAWLRLVNHSPYPLTGVISGGAVNDLVYDCQLPAGAEAGSWAVEMKPNDIRIFTVDAAPEKVVCHFSMPGPVAEAIKQETRYILGQKHFLENVPGDMIARLFEGVQGDDAFALYIALDDYEVAAHVKRAKLEIAAMDRQSAFLEDLAKTGAGRINCAGESAYVDPSGNRWHPDQRYLNCGAYGNENASYADRGATMIVVGTDAQRVYQTEAYGSRVTYRIPVPKGTYNVKLHFAETYAPIQRPGVRSISVKVESHLWEKKVDPFADAGGFAKAVVLSDSGIGIHDGVIDIDLAGSVGIQGIEIEKVK